MLNGLDSLDQFKQKDNKPTDIELFFYLFFDKGISLEKFIELPIPYIVSMIITHTYLNKENPKENKKKGLM